MRYTREMSRSALIDALLKRRGLETEHEIAAFLSPDYDLHTHSPFLLADMEIAVERILKAMGANERIAVYADFDCDGIPGAAILHDVFRKIGYTNVQVYLPHRDKEGYGLHPKAMEDLASQGVTLVITVDVGTTAVHAVNVARKRGVDVIITDHHELGADFPNAVALINPKRNPYPFPDLCGAGVAFKLALALITRGKEKGGDRFARVREGWEKWLLDLVAIATIADMVPLIGENRTLARWGLTVLRKSPRPGISALCNQLRLQKTLLTEDDIGFSIAPRVNAASRMDDPYLAFSLLTTTDSGEAQVLAAQLEKLNATRKGVVASIVREAKKRVRDRSPSGHVIVLGDPEWKPALLGLAANSIMEERGGVVCLWGRDVHGAIKGSCRSDGGLSIVELFGATKDVFQESGGHSASGGFTVAEGAVHRLPEVMEDAARTIIERTQQDLSADDPSEQGEIEADALISLREVSLPLYTDISQLAPFGMGNPKPVFRISRTHILEVRRFGKEKNHVEVSLMCSDSSVRARAFDFFRSPDDFTYNPAPQAQATVLATIERDTFRGGFALRLVDILPA